ncbi:SRPBCC family protein [Aurantiacibacter sp. D1-12]|uniref:SRPBCC family protein n=1 Tax=Aurantiacibacter sp. D1-12 TaxID=2993658 RepID=UPI00237D04F6|nr:SRPBCC family protein [Aurantiacibacter sp. D1-12]MDE1466879.1 SRPBCC family protein [Aurantiacibacter sp. D1-12]
MSEYGRLVTLDTMEFRRIFPAPPEKVWEFWVDPEKRKLWFCGGSTDGREGGELVFAFDHTRLSESPPPQKYACEEVAEHNARILAWDPPHRLAFTWFESQGDMSSEVDVRFTATEDGQTELHLVHTGLVGRDMLIGVFAGWHGHFDLLAEVLVGDRTTDFWIRDQELEAIYAERVPEG